MGPFIKKQKHSASIALYKGRGIFEKKDTLNHLIYSVIYN